MMAQWIQKQWSQFTFWHVLLLPISWLFCCLVSTRKFLYKCGILKTSQLSIPVIVVGNISVGGTGKTPLVIWLVEQLRLAGFKPGVISRGYGATVSQTQAVSANSQAGTVGDEPLLIARRASCPVYVSPNRVAAGKALIEHHPECDVIISDDGLQHYALHRDVEIAVLDGTRGLGNRALLPAGSLREPLTRLSNVDAVVVNGKANKALRSDLQTLKPIEMQLQSGKVYNLANHAFQVEPAYFSDKKILAIAGIGHPERFFEQLKNLGLTFESRTYPDHHAFSDKDLESLNADVVIMTEKDAVKCQAFVRANFWVLPVDAVVGDELATIVLNKLKQRVIK